MNLFLSFLLKFRLCVMVLVDDGNKFCGTFEKIDNTMTIKFHIVGKINHKAIGVKKFPKLLYHSQQIN